MQESGRCSGGCLSRSLAARFESPAVAQFTRRGGHPLGRPMSVALATVFAASFDIRHSSFVIHITFCSFPEHHQWNTSGRTLLALAFNCLMRQLRNGAGGISDIEGKATRVGASERGQQTSFNWTPLPAETSDRLSLLDIIRDWKAGPCLVYPPW